MAMRASMSIPGVFTPAEIDGQLLVDGGIIANLPIDVVREMGADFVIAVDIGDQLEGREKLGSMLAVTAQAMTIASNQNVESLRESAELLLRPEVASRGSLDFDNLAPVIAAGEAAAREQLAVLSDRSLSEDQYLRHRALKRPSSSPPQRVAEIDVRGLERVPERVVRRVMRTQVGEPLRFEVLRRDLERIYGLGDFESVDFEALPTADGLELLVVVREKRGGPFFLRSALLFDLDEDQNTSASFLANLTAIRLNSLGLEWRTDLKIGTDQLFESELYQPLDLKGRWFAAAGVARRENRSKLLADDRQVAEIEQVSRGGALDLGLALGSFGEIRIGAFRERRKLRLITGTNLELPPAVDLGGWRAGLSFDRLDSIYFPRRGQLGFLGVQAYRPDLGADDRFEVATMAHVGAWSVGRHTLLSWLELGGSLGEDQPAYAFFGGGGLFSFSGYRPGELFGASYAVARPTYFYRFGSLPAVIGKGLYAGGWLEAGNFWLSRDAASVDDLRYAATLVLGAETVIGPAYLAVGAAENGRWQIYLSVGPSFSVRPR